MTVYMKPNRLIAVTYAETASGNPNMVICGTDSRTLCLLAESPGEATALMQSIRDDTCEIDPDGWDSQPAEPKKEFWVKRRGKRKTKPKDDTISRKAVLDAIRPRMNSAREGSLEWQRLRSVYLEVEAMAAEPGKEETP